MPVSDSMCRLAMNPAPTRPMRITGGSCPARGRGNPVRPGGRVRRGRSRPFPMFLRMGPRRFDLAEHPVVVGILNRTRDSFSDRGAYYDLDRLLARAEHLVADGADVLQVGARPGGVRVIDVPPDEERDLAAGTGAALRSRFDVPLGVDTTRAAVAEAAFAEGAVLGNDMSGFRDPGYLAAAARAGATVVATHIRRPPGVPDPDPVYDDLLGEVCGRLSELARAAEDAGVDGEHVVPRPQHRPGQVLAAVAGTARPPRRGSGAGAAGPGGGVEQDLPAAHAGPRRRTARCRHRGGLRSGDLRWRRRRPGARRADRPAGRRLRLRAAGGRAGS